jgi:hypothetical protein
MAALSLGGAWRVFLAQPSPKLLLFICLSAWGLRIYEGVVPSSNELAVGVGMILYWPFQEWWMHRWLLHLGRVKLGRWSFEPDFTRLHREHHEEPDNIPLIFLPSRHILLALVAFSAVLYGLTSSVAWSATGMGCASFSTLLYEWTHYLTHSSYQPKSRYYRKIWQLHRWHHYKHEGYWFSFTLPYLDGWLGTGPDHSEVERSATARNLGQGPTGPREATLEAPLGSGAVGSP